MEAELAVHDALAAGSADVRQHIAALDDMLTLPDGRLVLLLCAVTGPTLHDLLIARQGGLELGEAVTALAPLVSMVEGAHDVGVTGVRLDSRRIRFAAGGAPVVISVAGATASPVLPARFREREAGYAEDHLALAHLVGVVAAATQEPAAAALRALAPRARGDRATATALFDLARPIPIRLDESSVLPRAVLDEHRDRVSEPVDRFPRDVAPIGAEVSPRTVSPPAVITALASALGSFGVPERMTDTVTQAAQSLGRWSRRLTDAVRVGRARAIERSSAWPVASSSRTPVRRGFAIAGVAGGLALTLAVLVSMTTQSPSDADPSSPSPPPATAGDGVMEAPESGSIESDESHSRGELDGTSVAESLPDGIERPEAGQWPALVTELVRRWGMCRAEVLGVDAGVSAECAATVVHPESSAHALLHVDDPRHDVLSSWLAQRGDVVIIERMGAAVLIDLVDPRSQTTAASLLLMRSEAGWRVRDVRD